MIRFVLSFPGIIFAAAALGAAPTLELPVACAIGRECFIQNHFDHDPGPAWRDYACGLLAYDGHTGTDFRVRNLRAMTDGVPVIAAAAGAVVGTRDGEADVSLRDQAVKGQRDAGNGVRIDHGDGWETQYSHLRKGSIRVRVGQRVAAGEPLGLIGLSGRTEFPHVDFTLRQDGKTVDPFAPGGAGACGDTAKALWSPAALKALAYQASGILDSGFAERVLSARELEAGDAYSASLAGTADGVVFHLVAFGPRRDDVEEMTLSDPSGAVLARRVETLTRNFAVRRAYLGKRRSAAAWPAGEYVGTYVLRRDGAVLVEATRRVRVAAAGD